MTLTSNKYLKKKNNCISSPSITISIVSHGHGNLVFHLLNDIKEKCNGDLNVYLTINKPEDLPFQIDDFPFIARIIYNSQPKGFAANHNAALLGNDSDYFCILNPDVRLINNPFPLLFDVAEITPNAGVIAPLIKNSNGEIEISARKFPNPLALFFKIFQKKLTHDYGYNEDVIFPDWVAGMFMLFPKEAYFIVRGFNEDYFLYYEDVDICARLTLKNKIVVLTTKVCVIHDAQKDSHRKLKYFLWHIKSMSRYFVSKNYFMSTFTK